MSMFHKARQRNLPANLVPRKPFVLDPEDYRIIDGDTLATSWPPQGLRMAIRFNTVDAPEIQHSFDPGAPAAGITHRTDHQGAAATDYFKAMADDRALLIWPTNSIDSGQRADMYGRLTAYIFVSGAPGPQFDFSGCFDIERSMLEAGHARTIPGRIFFRGDLAGHVHHWQQRGHDFTKEAAQRNNIGYDAPWEPRDVVDGEEAMNGMAASDSSEFPSLRRGVPPPEGPTF